MNDAVISRAIIRQLDKLSLEGQQKVLDFTKALAPSLHKGRPEKDLLRFAGVMDPDDAQAILQAVEASCKSVDDLHSELW
ncbi:MAG: hypothetical protein HYU88_12960 [Chloroflexi bacterium]|nr:hypothetical protein [Chloroflexota bacterium]